MGALHSAFLPPVAQAVLGFSCSFGICFMLPGSDISILAEIFPLFSLCSLKVSVFAECLC